jgi:hypothetical protein
MRIDLLQRATELQDKVASPRSPANAENEFASIVAQLAARSGRLRADNDPEDSTDRFAFAAQLAARAERLRADSIPPSPPPGIDSAEATSHSISSLLASGRAGYIWGGSLLPILVVSAALLIVWGPPSPPSKPFPPNRVEQAKADTAAAASVAEKDPPPVSPPRISLPAVSLPQVPQELVKSTPDAPLEASAPQTASTMQTNSASLTSNEIRELQSRLTAAGFGPGPVDGVAGPMTLGALRKYAQSRGIANAEATRDLLSRLRTESPRKK